MTIDQERLLDVAGHFKKPDRLPDWKSYISTEAQTPHYNMVRAAFEFALNASQNAGYTELDRRGDVIKWEIKGSGSSALTAFFKELRDRNFLPYFNLAASEVTAKIAPMLEGNLTTPELQGRRVPFADKRLKMFGEFARPEAFHAFEKIVKDARVAEGQYHFTFENTVVPLRECFPTSFGEDPLCKKALLAPILLTANARANGIEVTTDVPLPADYRLPVTLSKLGILVLDRELHNKIEANILFDQDDPVLLALRSATLLACEQLREVSGLAPQELDAALWMAATPSQDKTADRSTTSLQRPPNSYGMYI